MVAGRAAGLVSLAFLANEGSLGAHALTPRTFTVADSIESREIVDLGYEYGDAGAVHYSPHRSRFAVILRKGDLERNGVWLQVFVAQVDSLRSASDLRPVVRLLTAAKRNDATGRLSPLYDSQIRLIWLDEDHFAFLWNDGESETQLFAADIRTGAIRELTEHQTSIIRFGVSQDASSLAFMAYPASPPVGSDGKHSAAGRIVSTDSAFDFIQGHDPVNPWQRLELFVRGLGNGAPRRVPGALFRPDTRTPGHFSPNGRYALIAEQFPAAIPKAWKRYRDSELQRRIRRVEAEPRLLGTYDAGLSQPYLIGIEKATIAPLVDAPLNPDRTPSYVWSCDSRFITVGPMFAPLDIGAPSSSSESAILTVDVETGQVERTSPSDGSSRAACTSPPDASAIKLDWRQTANDSPRLFATESASAASGPILDLNPGLQSRFVLGRVETLRWTDAAHREWTARLYYPSGYRRGSPLPLVIQTHGHAPLESFSLRGNSSTTLFTAQALANRGMMVLQIQDRADLQMTPGEAHMYMQAYEAAIAEMSGRGLIDRNRVALAGFSRTGWHVEYALTQSEFDYRAAIVADNIDGSYVQAVLHGGDVAWEFAKDTGAEPYSYGLDRWLQRAPGFNAERLITPLRMEVDSGGALFALAAWEVYGRLFVRSHPVELFLVPDSEHSDHPLQIPLQQYVSQEGAVDWFDFWLNGREVPSPSKVNQYARWRRLRELRDALQAKPRAPLLDWQAVPRR